MAIIEQCNNCGRGLGSCPYFNQEEVNPCQYYLKPIDNSRFFSHFLSAKGRIGRCQYLVTALIAIVICVVLYFIVSAIVGPSAAQDYSALIFLLCLIPTVVLIVLAGIKRAHDISEDGAFAMYSFLHLYCKEGDEGLNAYGSEPLKPFEDQVNWQQET